MGQKPWSSDAIDALVDIRCLTEGLFSMLRIKQGMNDRNKHDKRELVTEIVSSPGSSTRLNTSLAKAFVASGPDKGKSIHVGTHPVILGSGTETDLVLVDRSISRRHAKLFRQGDVVIIEDLGSTNGTFFKDVRVGQVHLPLGQEVRFGQIRVKLIPEEEALTLPPSTLDRLGPLIGSDKGMREIFALIQDIAPSDVTVVIEGETGTGKELVAQAIHDYSARKPSPFVVFDCSNQPRDLIESALFGHVKGAFTGATNQRAGAFGRANKGTIFLDELGEFGKDLQPKLLRVLEAREIQKVGSDGYEAINVRIIAATNRNLKAEVRAERFREDLYYRLAVVKIVLPSLRERLGDIPMLVDHFLSLQDQPCEVDSSCFRALAAYHWPGNVRELKNVVDRASALNRGKSSVDLSLYLTDRDEVSSTRQLQVDEFVSFKAAKGKVVAEFESQYIETLLRQHKNNISLAAREAGIDRKHFKELMRKHGIEANPQE
jgi:transcriptional regulator with GAF, ATPase, and Fis domain